jgi:hypothetical protein
VLQASAGRDRAKPGHALALRAGTARARRNLVVLQASAG